MDPVTINTLLALVLGIAQTATKYGDENMPTVSPEAFHGQLQAFEEMLKTPLPESYDIGFVDSVMDTIHGWLKK